MGSTDQVPQIQAGMQSLTAVCIGVAAVAAVMVTGQITSVPGIPGQDYPTLDFYNLPSTSFDCQGRVNGGFYSDEEAFCQMYHMCVAEPAGSYKKYSFLCPNGTIFNQETLVCSPWFKNACLLRWIALATPSMTMLQASTCWTPRELSSPSAWSRRILRKTFLGGSGMNRPECRIDPLSWLLILIWSLILFPIKIFTKKK